MYVLLYIHLLVGYLLFVVLRFSPVFLPYWRVFCCSWKLLCCVNHFYLRCVPLLFYALFLFYSYLIHGVVSRLLVEFVRVQESLCVVSVRGCDVSGNGVTEGGGGLVMLARGSRVGRVVAGYLSFCSGLL
jgi:hypothetical protein